MRAEEMRQRHIEQRHAQKRASFAKNYFSPTSGRVNVDSSIVKAWIDQAQANTMKLQMDMWKNLLGNTMEVVMLKSSVMMLEVMGGGIPEHWGTPTHKTKHLYHWNDISEPREAEACLSDKMWSLMPPDSYFVSWTNNRGTERHHIGNAEKFSMCVSAPRFGDNFEQPYFNPVTTEEEWQGKWLCEEEDESK